MVNVKMWRYVQYLEIAGLLGLYPQTEETRGRGMGVREFENPLAGDLG